METYLLVLFLAGAQIEHPDPLPSREACISAGKGEVAAFKKHHPHARGWFWCLKRYST